MNTGTGAIAAGVVRLVLLAMAATGFLAMHGVAATDPVAGHISPLDSHSVMAPAESAVAMPDVGPETVASSGNPRHHHDDMAACAFILLTVLAGIVLHALGVAAGGRSRGGSALIRSRWSPPRAPPQPLFLSLCVFRL